MGMAEGEFEKMRLGVFFLKLHFFNKERRERYMMFSALFRMHAFQIINSTRQKPLTDPKLLWKIDGEDEGKQTYTVPKDQMTDEFLKKIDDLLG